MGSDYNNLAKVSQDNSIVAITRNSGKVALLRKSGTTYVFDEHIIDDSSLNTFLGLGISSDNTYIVTCTETKKLVVMKKNSTGGYDRHQTTDMGFSDHNSLYTSDMSADGQYIVAHTITEVKILKFNSGTTNFEIYQTISSLSDAVYISISGDGGYFALSIRMVGVKIYKNDGSTFSLWKTVGLEVTTPSFNFKA